MTSPLPLPSPADPGRAFPWPGSELPAHPVWQTLHLPYFTGWGGWRHARAGLASAAAGEGRGQSLQRGLQPRGLRTGETRAPPCREGRGRRGACPEPGRPSHRAPWCPSTPNSQAGPWCSVSSSLARPDRPFVSETRAPKHQSIDHTEALGCV